MGDKRNESKKENHNEEVKALYIPVCGPWRDCCPNNEACEAQLQYYPQTDQYALSHCGCN